MHYESGVGHIGGNLSCLDMLMVLYHRVLRPEDLFVLSKGHAAGALYVALWSVGALTEEDLGRFHQDDTPLSGHPAPNRIPQIRFATGSLGHGLSLAAGVALGKRLKHAPGRTYCLLSDGECEEGSTWEGVLFAAHHRLPVTVLVDANGLQGFGTTQEILSLEPLTEKFRAFGLPTVEIDGHDPQAIAAACAEVGAGPVAIVARTHKGNGVSYMQDRMEWHYLPMSEAQYTQAGAEANGE
jgi:transketolase